MRDYLEQCREILGDCQGINTAFDGKHGLYMRDDASPLLTLWTASDYKAAKIDLISDDAAEAQGNQGRRLRFGLGYLKKEDGTAEGYPSIVAVSNHKVRFFPPVEFMAWAGALKGIADNEIALLGFPAMELALLFKLALAEPIEGMDEAAILEEVRGTASKAQSIALAIVERLEAKGLGFFNSLFAVERATRLCKPKKGEGFSGYAARALAELEEQKEGLGSAANEQAMLKAVDDLRAELSEVKQSQELATLWEGVFSDFLNPSAWEEEPEEDSAYLIMTETYVMQPSPVLATSLERMTFGAYSQTTSREDKEKAEAYKKALAEYPAKLADIERRIAETQAALNALSPFDDEEPLKAKKAELEAERNALQEELKALSRNLIIGQDGQSYIHNEGRYNLPTFIGTDGKAEYTLQNDNIYLRVSVPTETALRESNSKWVKADLTSVLKHRIIEKCRANHGKPKVFFTWAEVYSMVGGIVDENGEKEGRKMFMRAVNILMDTQIAFKTKGRRGRGKGFAFVSGYSYDEGGAGIELEIYSDFAAEIGKSGVYVIESKAAKSLPSPSDQTAYWTLRQREHIKGGNPYWNFAELAEALGITIDKIHALRTENAILKRIDAFKAKGLISTFEELEKRKRYKLVTADGVKDNKDKRQWDIVKRLAKQYGIRDEQARQALERANWDFQAAEEDIRAKAKSRAIRRHKAKRPTGDS